VEAQGASKRIKFTPRPCGYKFARWALDSIFGQQKGGPVRPPSVPENSDTTLHAEELQSAEDDLANERFAILHRYENQILNLQIKEHVLAHLAAGFRTGSYSTSNTKKFYGQVTGQLASVRSALDAAQQQQTRDLLENNGEDQAAMARIRAEIATQIAAQIREHDQDVRRQIDERVAEVIQDLAQDPTARGAPGFFVR